MSIDYSLTLSLVALCLALIALGFSIYVAIDYFAGKNSTHKFVMLDPSKQEFENLTEEKRQEMTRVSEEYRSII